MRRDGKNMAKVKRFCRTARRWLRPVALALLLLFALALGRSDVFERLAPTPSPKPSAAATQGTPTPHAPRPAGPDTPVWISRFGGRYHATSSCSSMTAPIGTTLGDAEAAGYSPCGVCWAAE